MNLRLAFFTSVLALNLPLATFSQKNSNFSKPISINPDSYTLALSKVGQKWDNKVGGLYDQEIINAPKYDLNVSIGAFINIHDFSEKQLFSWQLWRGNIGLATSIQIHDINWLNKRSSLSVEIAAKHESQHATDVTRYINTYMYIHPQDFGNARSFEYLQLTTEYRSSSKSNKSFMTVLCGYKYFSKPAIIGSYRILRNAFFLESGIEWKFKNNGYFYSKLYVEIMQNNFISERENYQGNWNKEPFVYRILESGVYYKNKNEKLIGLFFNYSNSNGRGYDFTDTNKQFGFGLRIDIN